MGLRKQGVKLLKFFIGREKLVKEGFKKLGVGKLLKLNIDPKQGQISCSLDLAGENAPITIEIGKYSLVKKGNTNYLTISDVKINKAWMEILAQQYIKKTKGEIQLPDAAKDLLPILE